MVIYTVNIIFMVFSVLLRSPVFSFVKARQSAWQSAQKLQVLSAHTIQRTPTSKAMFCEESTSCFIMRKNLKSTMPTKPTDWVLPSVLFYLHLTLHADKEVLYTANYPCLPMSDFERHNQLINSAFNCRLEPPDKFKNWF